MRNMDPDERKEFDAMSREGVRPLSKPLKINNGETLVISLSGLGDVESITVRGVVLVGIDPGAATGLFALQVTGAGIWRYVGHRVINKPSHVGKTAPENLAEMGMRIAAQLREWRPSLVVLEEPKDGGTGRNWSGKGERRETPFAMGGHYGAAVMACRIAEIPHFVSYPVKGSRNDPGWMPAATSRARIFQVLRLKVAQVGAPDGLKEHCLAAYGVLEHHLAGKLTPV